MVLYKYTSSVPLLHVWVVQKFCIFIVLTQCHRIKKDFFPRCLLCIVLTNNGDFSSNSQGDVQGG